MVEPPNTKITRVVSDDAALMQKQMTMGMNPTIGQDINKVFQSENENLELVRHKWALENVEQEVLEKKPKMKKGIKIPPK
jgi:hypothetical protein